MSRRRHNLYYAREYNQPEFVASLDSLLRHTWWDGECFMWNDAKPGTYGLMRDPEDPKMSTGPHRIMYRLLHDLRPEDMRGLFVCHSCDKPGCITPRHLWLGTHADNMRDMAAKGRSRNGASAMAQKTQKSPA